MAKRGFKVELSTDADDNPLMVGKGVRIVTNQIREALAATFAEHPGDYDIDIVVTIQDRDD